MSTAAMTNIHNLINAPTPTPPPPPSSIPSQIPQPLSSASTTSSPPLPPNSAYLPPPLSSSHTTTIHAPPPHLQTSFDDSVVLDDDEDDHEHDHEHIHTSKQTNKKLLSTSSPEGIQVAAKITPTRLANLLIRKGPLPIRHITHQLSLEVSSFDQLSLSKQRRLIMAAMEQTDLINNVVFEKIGWGQWAVRKVNSDYIVTEGTEVGNGGNSHSNGGKTSSISNLLINDDVNSNNEKLINVNDLRNKTNLKLGWSKKQNQNNQHHTSTSHTASVTTATSMTKKDRRESITNNNKNLHNLKLPKEPKSSTAIASDSDDENDIDLEDVMEGNDDEDDDEMLESTASSSDEEEDDEEELFPFDNDDAAKRLRGETSQAIPTISTSTVTNDKSTTSPPPIKFAKRVPIKISPPPSTNGERRRKSSSSVISKPTNPHRYQIFNRSRLASFDGGLDNYIVSSAKNSSVSINSPPPLTSSSPLNSWSGTTPDLINLNSTSTSNNANYIHDNNSASFIIEKVEGGGGRRKSSFNESHIRSTLSSSLPHPHPNVKVSTSQSTTITTTNTTPYENAQFAKSTPSSIHSKLEDDGSTTHRSNHHHHHHRHHRHHNNQSEDDTDEEDWATIGPESLRKNSITSTKKKINSTTNTPRSISRHGSGQHHHNSYRKFSSSSARSRSGERIPIKLESAHSSPPVQPQLENNIDSMMDVDVDDEQRSAAFALVDLRN